MVIKVKYCQHLKYEMKDFPGLKFFFHVSIPSLISYIYIYLSISTVTGIEIGNIEKELKNVNLLSPRYPDFPEAENKTEMRCVIRHTDRDMFRFKTLETWFDFKGHSEHAVKTQFILIAESKILTMPVRKVNPFNRYLEFSDVIDEDLNELLIWYSNSPYDLKFMLKIKGIYSFFSEILNKNAVPNIGLKRFCL